MEIFKRCHLSSTSRFFISNKTLSSTKPDLTERRVILPSPNQSLLLLLQLLLLLLPIDLDDEVNSEAMAPFPSGRILPVVLQ